ncbi:MAG: FtsQ-type POTRA domain-containing protein [Chlorobiaceae bacterium]|nr:FtsQ-type POTRA domain-containing protein [Chlorobiaceae bacterium]NTW09844.1 FtsQ-type POTRA domain-containing protein [Chlorobiaceae bacterium]
MHESDYEPGQGFSISGKEEPPPGKNSGGWKLLFLVFILVLGVLGALAYSAGKWKKDVEVSRIVVDGASLVPETDIVNALKSCIGSKVLDVDTEELRKRVLRFSFVSDAVLNKEMNGVLRVRLFERVPVVRTILEGKRVDIDRDGVLLPENSRIQALFPKLPVVSGIRRLTCMSNGLQRIPREDAGLIDEFVTALGETEYASLLVSEFHLEDNNMSYCLSSQSPTRFILGNDGNFKEKLKKFEIFWQKVMSKKGFDVYEAVDLRFRDRVFTRDTVSVKVPRQVFP